MKKIFAVYRDDLKKIKNNIFALIIVVGIIIIPALYAWFNIDSNHDPYSATSGIKIAVANNDTGAQLEGSTMNIGDQIVAELAQNDSIGWQFTDEQTARDGVDSGEYYAALIIPDDFSSDMLSVVSDQVERPVITYLSNEKKNAIAPKITNTGVSTVQNQVNQTFIETAAKVMSTILNQASTDLQNNKSELTGEITGKLNDMISNLQQYQSLISVIVSASGTLESTLDIAKDIVPDANQAIDQAKQAGESASQLADSSQNAIQSLQTTLTSTITLEKEGISTLTDDINSFVQDVKNSGSKETLLTELSKASGALSSAIQLTDSVTSSLQQVQDSLSTPLTSLQKLIDKVSALQTTLKSLQESFDNAQKQIEAGSELSDSLISTIQSASDSLSSQTDDIQSQFSNSVLPDLNSLFDSLDSTLDSVNNLLGTTQSTTTTLNDATESMKTALGQSEEALNETKTLIGTVIDKLNEYLNEINSAADSEKLNTALQLLERDPTVVSSFLKAPVDVDTEKVYPIANYGSGMAPFYTTLAIWVGALVNVAILKTKICDPEKFGGLTPTQAYFGRYLLFATVSIAQGLTICLGDLFILHVQCLDPGLFCLMGVTAALVYSLLIYTLTISFGDVGKAIAVILLVLQVAGSGGTFPIEVLPKFYQNLYPWFPFNYSINAMRECIGGIYASAYWKDWGMELLFIPVSLLLGLVLRRPIIGLKEKIEEKIESTGLIG